jgi:hypothetical protein
MVWAVFHASNLQEVLRKKARRGLASTVAAPTVVCVADSHHNKGDNMADKAENTKRLLADAERANVERGSGEQIQWIGVSLASLYEAKAGPYEIREMAFLPALCVVQTEMQGLIPFFSHPDLNEVGVQLMYGMLDTLDDADIFQAVLALQEEQK